MHIAGGRPAVGDVLRHVHAEVAFFGHQRGFHRQRRSDCVQHVLRNAVFGKFQHGGVDALAQRLHVALVHAGGGKHDRGFGAGRLQIDADVSVRQHIHQIAHQRGRGIAQQRRQQIQHVLLFLSRVFADEGDVGDGSVLRLRAFVDRVLADLLHGGGHRGIIGRGEIKRLRLVGGERLVQQRKEGGWIFNRAVDGRQGVRRMIVGGVVILDFLPRHGRDFGRLAALIVAHVAAGERRLHCVVGRGSLQRGSALHLGIHRAADGQGAVRVF